MAKPRCNRLPRDLGLSRAVSDFLECSFEIFKPQIGQDFLNRFPPQARGLLDEAKKRVDEALTGAISAYPVFAQDVSLLREDIQRLYIILAERGPIFVEDEWDVVAFELWRCGFCFELGEPLDAEYWVLFHWLRRAAWFDSMGNPESNHPYETYSLQISLEWVQMLLTLILLLMGSIWPRLPSERVSRTRDILFLELDHRLSEVESLLKSNVDRWISSRLGLNPDQWSTLLWRLLIRIRRSFDDRHRIDSEHVSALGRELGEFQDDLDSLRFDSVTVDGNAKGQEGGLRVKADPENKTVYLDGEPFPVRSRITAVYLQAVIESGEKPISGSQISERYPEFPADKVTRYRERLPIQIQELIDASQGSGSCLKPEAWKKSES